jgi:hypothetical protein
MKMLKKVTAVLVVLLLVLGTMSIGTSAAVDSGSVGITITADKTTNLYPGDIVTFTVNISTNFHYTGMRWPVMYTLKAFDPVIANDGNGDTDYGNVNGLGQLLAADSYLESAEAVTNDPFGTPYTKANYGCMLIQWTGATSGTSVTNFYAPNGEDCLTFQLRVKAGYTANKGVATVAIPTTNQAKSLFYYEGVEFPNNANSTFFLTSTTMTVTSTPCTVTIIKEAPGMLPKDGSPTVIDSDSGVNYIYGFNTIFAEYELIDEDTIFKYVTLTGNARLELIPNDMGMISTGATLRLYDASDLFLDEYTVVVFGDINGDCVMDLTDSNMLIDGYLYTEEWSWGDTVKDNATFFSCDVNGDGYVDSTDYGPLFEALLTRGYVNQTNDPENCFIYTT